MPAPLTLINRFELLLVNSPASLSAVLGEFAARDVSPTSVNAVSQGSGNLAVTVIVKRLGENSARCIEQKLKAVPAVKQARLEHMVN